jgi:type I restriction enzyme S subunit
MSEWKKYKLKEICQKITDGSHSSPQAQSDGYPMFSVKDMLEFGFDYSKCKYISLNDFLTLKQNDCVPLKGDVLVAKDGSYLKQIFVCKETKEEGILSSIAIFRPNNIVDSYFLCYLLKSPEVFNYISNNCVSGSALPRIVLKDFKEVSLRVPSRETQDKIVDILKSLDDKIEVNRRINENLEQQAQALFKSWFVDFEPFKDQPFVESELGMIPEGWRVAHYDDIIETTISGDWGKEKPEGNYIHKVACIRGCDFQDIKNGLRGKTPERYILEKNYQSKHFKDNDILVEISGGTPTVSTGRVCPVSKLLIDKFEQNIVCTNFCRLVRPKRNHGAFLYYSWIHKYNNKVMFGYENGTSGIKNFRIKDFISIEPVVIPSEEAIFEFQSLIDIYQMKMQMNGSVSQKLASLRDTLLPHLMSGELEIQDIEQSL